MAKTTTDPYAESAERFRSDTKDHELTILHDDGLYRHLRFKRPETGMYWFELITWPGALAFRGDTNAQFIFSRETDMFPFFRARAGWNDGTINPGYWAEKIQDGRSRAVTYSEKLFREQVWSAVRQRISGATGGCPGLAKAVEAAMTDDYNTSYEEGALEMLRDFDWEPEEPKQAGAFIQVTPKDEPFRFVDAREWGIKDFDHWYLWACHAIQWGIDQYDAAKSAVPATAS